MFLGILFLLNHLNTLPRTKKEDCKRGYNASQWHQLKQSQNAFLIILARSHPMSFHVLWGLLYHMSDNFIYSAQFPHTPTTVYFNNLVQCTLTNYDMFRSSRFCEQVVAFKTHGTAPVSVSCIVFPAQLWLGDKCMLRRSILCCIICHLVDRYQSFVLIFWVFLPVFLFMEAFTSLNLIWRLGMKVSSRNEVKQKWSKTEMK